MDRRNRIAFHQAPGILQVQCFKNMVKALRPLVPVQLSGWPNQLRLMLSSYAYVLFDYIRRTALRNTRLASATSATIRNKRIRIGAVSSYATLAASVII